MCAFRTHKLEIYDEVVAPKEPRMTFQTFRSLKSLIQSLFGELSNFAGLGQWRQPPFCVGNNWLEADNGKRGREARNAEVSASPLISLSVSDAAGKRLYLFCQTSQVQVLKPFQYKRFRGVRSCNHSHVIATSDIAALFTHCSAHSVGIQTQYVLAVRPHSCLGDLFTDSLTRNHF